jgi:hypothetical protein
LPSVTTELGLFQNGTREGWRWCKTPATELGHLVCRSWTLAPTATRNILSWTLAPAVTDLQPKKHKATSELTGVIFLTHLPCCLILILFSAWWHVSTSLLEVLTCHLLMLAMCLCEAYYDTIYVLYHVLCISLSHTIIQYHCWWLLLFICRLWLLSLYSKGSKLTLMRLLPRCLALGKGRPPPPLVTRVPK